MKAPRWLLAVLALLLAANLTLAWRDSRSTEAARRAEGRAAADSVQLAATVARFDSLALVASNLRSTLAAARGETQVARGESRRMADSLSKVSTRAVALARDTSVTRDSLVKVIVGLDSLIREDSVADEATDAAHEREVAQLTLTVATQRAAIEAGQQALADAARAHASRVAANDAKWRSQMPTLRDKAVTAVLTVGVWEGGKALARSGIRP